jgi:hypothetical protein
MASWFGKEERGCAAGRIPDSLRARVQEHDQSGVRRRLPSQIVEHRFAAGSAMFVQHL